MNRTRIKICGITRPEHALAAAAIGVDAIGLVFYPPSSRALDTETARRIVTVLPPFVCSVGLFMNAEPEAVRDTLRQVPLSLLQFHGDETPDYCAAFGRPYIKAVPMGAGADVMAYAQRFQHAAGLLLDSHGGTRAGGTGRCFDWNIIPSAVPRPLILAGGLNPENVTRAVQRIRPYAVDVSSGVESTKGIKDIHLMQTFVRGVESGESRACKH
jgi:phosphoribosylanthranilate isomerase